MNEKTRQMLRVRLERLREGLIASGPAKIEPTRKDDAALARYFTYADQLTADPHVLTLALEYRHIAGLAPPSREIGCAADIALGPLEEVHDMLRADKLQNYKDFLAHHASHPRAAALDRYFRLWLERLGIDEAMRGRCFAAMDQYAPVAAQRQLATKAS